jgi:hypothetical protein
VATCPAPPHEFSFYTHTLACCWLCGQGARPGQRSGLSTSGSLRSTTLLALKASCHPQRRELCGKRPFLEPVYAYKQIDQFTKTGSGQTLKTLRGEDTSLQVYWGQPHGINGSRTNYTILRSMDQGAHWSILSPVVYPAGAGYSSLTLLPHTGPGDLLGVAFQLTIWDSALGASSTQPRSHAPACCSLSSPQLAAAAPAHRVYRGCARTPRLILQLIRRVLCAVCCCVVLEGGGYNTGFATVLVAPPAAADSDQSYPVNHSNIQKGNDQP